MSRKITLILVFFLFLLPFVSWYYLKSGLDWRKQAQDVLNGTAPFPKIELQNLSGNRMEASQLENHVSLVTLVSCDSLENQMEVITRLYSQFKLTHKANFLFIDTCSSQQLSLPDSLVQGIYTIACDDSTHSCAALLNNWPTGKPFALLDKRGVIRAYYAANSHDEKRILVEHMALLLPRELGEKVEIKREEGN